MKLSLEWSMDDQPYEGFRKIPHMSILIIHQKISHLYDFFGGHIFSCLYSKICLIGSIILYSRFQSLVCNKFDFK